MGGKKPAFKPSSKAHVRKVFAVWKAMCDAGIPDNRTRAGLVAFVKRQTGVDDPEWLTPDQANKVTEGLKAWAKRKGAV
jgi:predicted DNA-binding transcriptional regulator YafY